MKMQLNYIWRVIATGLSYVLFGVGLVFLSLLFMLGVRFLPIAQSIKKRWLANSIHRLSRLFVQIMQWLGLISLVVEGVPLSQLKGHLIISNHPSLIDALFITAATPNLCCIVKEALWYNPLTRYVVKLGGYIPNHSLSLLSDASNAIARGSNLLIFPEGTRNTHDKQLDFKRGAANIALTADCPITPVLITWQPRTLQKGDKWYSVPATTPKIVMTTYPCVTSLDYVDTQKPVTLQARQLIAGLTDFYRQRMRTDGESILVSTVPEALEPRGRLGDGHETTELWTRLK